MQCGNVTHYEQWRDNVIRDLKTMAIDNWMDATLDRNRSRQIVFAAKIHEVLVRLLIRRRRTFAVFVLTVHVDLETDVSTT